MSNNAINISSLSSAIVTNEDGVFVATSSMTDGQVLIGSTGAAPVAASLTAGSGISITPGAGALTIAYTATPSSAGKLINVQYLTTSGTYTATAGTISCLVLAVAAGGGGGGSSSGSTIIGGGGGGGAACYKYYTTAPTGTAYVIGAGGSGGAAGGNYGTAGGATTFNGGDLNVRGGARGIRGTTANGFSAAGGTPDPSDNSDFASNGACSFFNNLVATGCVGSAGGGSGLGIGQGGVTIINANTNNGTTPTGYGGGGSGGVTRSTGTSAGAPGAPGIIIVWEYS